MNQFLLLIALLIATAVLLQVNFAFYIAYVCIGIFAWSRWFTPFALRQLRIERRFADHAFLGEDVPIELRFHNQSWLRLPWLQYGEGTAVELQTGDAMKRAFSLAPQETAVFTYKVRAMKRGFYRLGPLQLISSDLFGITKDQRAQVPPQNLTVYPRIVTLSQLGLPSRLPFGTIASQQRLFADPARPMGVRSYRSGDSLRQINWKVSAHTRDLMVKTFEPAISLETMILLNLNLSDYWQRERYMTVEWGIVVAASLAAHLSSQRQAVGMVSNGIDPLGGVEEATFDDASGRLLGQGANQMAGAIMPRNGRSHLMKILERLARIEPENTVSFNDWATTACMPLSWGTTLLVVTPKGDEATCQTLHRLLRAGYNPVLLVIEPGQNFGEIRARARQLGFLAFSVIHEQDLNRWRYPLASD